VFIEIPPHIEKFEKFTSFVSEKSGITIVMDGTKAQTNGKEITLPNLMGMTEREVEFLYGLLLHEVGHIKHSCFDQEMFKKMKTDYHFLIVNSIEDARIENKVMKEYEGAKDIFGALYNDYASDPEFMGRLFGKAAAKNSNAFFVFTIKLHQALLDIPVKSVRCPKKTEKESNEMMLQVAKLVSGVNLKSNEDSLELGTKIYEIIFKQAHEDKSQPIKVEETEKAIEKDKKGLDILMQELKEAEAQVAKMKDGVKALKGERDQTFKELLSHEKQSKPTLNATSEKQQQLRKKIGDNSEFKEASNRVAQAHQAICDVEDQIEKFNRKAKRNEKKLAEAKAIDKTDMSAEDIKKAKSDQKRRENLDGKFASQTKSLKKSIEGLQEKLNEAEAKLEEAKNKSFTEDGKSVSDLEKESDQLNADINPIYEKQSQLENKKYDLTQKVKTQLKDIRQLRKEVAKEAGKKMVALDKAMREAGVGGILPDFEKANDWEDADKGQEQFDQQASKALDTPVVNGKSALGTDVRSIMFRLQDVSDKLDNIDISALIGKRLQVSKLECVNDMTSEFTEQSETGDAKPASATAQARPHIPLTTEYDRVIERVAGGNPRELDPIREKNAQAIAHLTNVLKAKFRFKQKHIYRHGKEDGILDTREIWRIPNGLGINVFEVDERHLDSKVQASIAVDISGSMDKDATEHGDKVKALTVVLSDALTGAHVRHEVVGYGAPICADMGQKDASRTYNRRMNSLETLVYRTASGANGLQNLELQPVDNSDGESLRLVGMRLQKAAAKKKVAFVITDGKPFLTDADTDALDADLHKAIAGLRRKGMAIYAFGFNDAPKAFYGDNYCKVGNMEDVSAFLSKKLEQVN